MGRYAQIKLPLRVREQIMRDKNSDDQPWSFDADTPQFKSMVNACAAAIERGMEQDELERSYSRLVRARAKEVLAMRVNVRQAMG